jgi:hypothetical protein
VAAGCGGGARRPPRRIADIGDNECDRTDTTLLKVREPDPAANER